jgi:hypothetical protein
MAELNITLISSFHKIQGNCNPRELYKIIEHIQPDVIFEELSNNGFEIIYSKYYQPETTEAITIKQYLQRYPIKHFPVDNYPVNEKDLLSDAQIIWDNSKEYRELWNEKMNSLNERGYYFLNSDECTKIIGRLNKIEEAVLTETKNFNLLTELKAEKLLHDIRETEMLRCIYDIATQHPFDRAVLICGAEHREGIRKKIKDFEKKENNRIKWTFFNET